MALSQRLELRQGQTLIMTPQLMQAIKLLQLSTLELSAFIEQELQENPLLERDESTQETAKHESVDDNPPRANVTEIISDQAEQLAEVLDAPKDSLYGDDIPLSSGMVSSLNTTSSFVAQDSEGFEAYTAQNESLRDVLTHQLSVLLNTAAEKMIGAYLIDSIDDDGYLRLDLTDASEKLGVEFEECERILKLIQSLEPTGVGARNLSECLSLQLREKDRLDPCMQCLLNNLERLARYEHAEIMALCDVDQEDFADMLAELRSLNPRPGMGFAPSPVASLIPDVFVRKGADGGWHIELNNEALPRVLVNQTYYAKLCKSRNSEKDKLFLGDCMQKASWLVKSLDQRAHSILKVAQEIVRQQDAFFEYGVHALKPINLKAIAEAAKLHESTVSRVTTNKFMATPRGIFDMKYFFTSAIATTHGGDAVSSESVRERIRVMIDAEKPSGILSDDAIVQNLKNHGIDIARRTVTKYREAMNIPSSPQRRRIKRSKISA